MGGATRDLESVQTPVRRDPLAAGLDGRGGVVGIGHDPASGTGVPAQPREDSPVSWTGSDHLAVVGPTQRIGEGQNLVRGGRPVEDPWMGSDADQPAQSEVTHPESAIRVDHFREPADVARVIG